MFVPPTSKIFIILKQIKMKTTLIKGLLIAGLSFTSLLSKANTVNEASIQVASKIIKDAVNIPASLHGNTNKVEILFSTNKNGDVNFAFAKTEDAKLKKEIEKQFYKIHLNKLNQDVVNSIVLNFKTI